MPVDLKALSTGTKLIAAAGLLLLIDTFLAWQKVSVEVSGVEVASASQNAWHGFWGVVMGLALIALLVWVGLQIANVDLNVSLPEATVTAALAGIVFVFALLKNLIDDYSAWPSYVGVVLAALVAAGAWMRLQETETETAAAPAAPAAPPAAPPADPTPPAAPPSTES
jgi:protein-S-isoprenylcysteine O-methyltransferase Ste14